MFSLAELHSVLPIVRAAVPATPQYAWPLLRARTGVDVVVKHENHTPIGAFKVRGGLVYFHRLKRERPQVKGVITATRGNHGQSFAFAGAQKNVPVAIVVPHGNSAEKNAAMRAFGAELIEHGRDFDEAKERAAEIAEKRGFEFGPSFHRDLVIGGLGSGICGLIGVRDALGLATRIVGVVSDRANTYRLSLDADRIVPTNSALTFADGVAVRAADPAALEIIKKGAERIVEVSDEEIAEAIRILFSDTHTLAEGAGAAALAALIQERARHAGRRVGVIVTGQNIDRPWMQIVLSGGTPRVA